MIIKLKYLILILLHDKLLKTLIPVGTAIIIIAEVKYSKVSTVNIW